MTASIKEPIIVVCDEVLVFESLSHAITFIEPWDAEDCSPVYDSEGRLLRVYQSSKLEEQAPRAKSEIPSWVPAFARRYVQWYMDRQQRYFEQQLADFKLTKIEALEREPTHQSELRQVLIDWLSSTSAWRYEHKRSRVLVTKEELSREPLEQLVNRALEDSVK
jgi:hypothetical protein